MEVSAEILGNGALKISAGNCECVVSDSTDEEACQKAIDMLVDNVTGNLRHRLIMATVRATMAAA